jgi:HSP20 family molecular chaperone IbpA
MAEKSAAAVQPALSRPPIKTGKMENLLERINRIHDVIARRAYELFERERRAEGNDVRHWLEAEKDLLLPVNVTMEETESEIVVQAEVSGFTADDLEVNVEPRCLTITGLHQSKTARKKAGVVESEESSEEIFRSIELPSEVNTTKISATLKDGVLNVQMPKLEARKSKSVEQQAA